MSVSVSAADSRDDSGNSSCSNSSVRLSLEQLPTSDSTAVTAVHDSGLWQPDCSLSYYGYELADVDDASQTVLPLHKSVCCALCRLDIKKYLLVRRLGLPVYFLLVPSQCIPRVTSYVTAAVALWIGLRFGTRIMIKAWPTFNPTLSIIQVQSQSGSGA